MAGQVETSVRGLRTLSGGTRQEVKTARPWQPKLVFPESREKCPLCTKNDETKYIPGPGWKIFQNAFTPFPYHRLMIPDDCWDEARLRTLGGKETLKAALRYALMEIKRTRESLFPTSIFTHIGYGGGQNIPHHHWHICGTPTKPKSFFFDLAYDLRPDQILEKTDNLTAAIFGVRAGQTIIFPTELYPMFPTNPRLSGKNAGVVEATSLLKDDDLFDEVAGEAHRVVELFNRKFFCPDYCLLLALNSESDWYVRYTPTLNNWGGSEYMAIDNDTPFCLPWPHENTVKFLKG